MQQDVQFAVTNISRYNQNRGRAHWNAVKRIMWYLRDTVDMKLTYRRDEEAMLHGSCDADWANDEQHGRSITGYVFILQGCDIVDNRSGSHLADEAAKRSVWPPRTSAATSNMFESFNMAMLTQLVQVPGRVMSPEVLVVALDRI